MPLLVVVDPTSGVPVYRQLMDQVKFHVASGMLRGGDELPSTRALSSELGLNPMTISKAYGLLEREGVVERRPGLPLVVKATDGDAMVERKLEQLRAGLTPTVAMIHQLGIDPEQAMKVLGALLGKADEPDTEKEADPS